jgi:hypothetical protein
MPLLSFWSMLALLSLQIVALGKNVGQAVSGKLTIGLTRGSFPIKLRGLCWCQYLESNSPIC